MDFDRDATRDAIAQLKDATDATCEHVRTGMQALELVARQVRQLSDHVQEMMEDDAPTQGGQT